jgi:streptogramin lyase
MNDMTGASWTTLGHQGAGVKEFFGPSALFVDVAGRIYVADSQNNRIVRMDDMTGAGWVTLGAPGFEVNHFSSPQGIFVDGAGRIYVADSQNHRIVRMDDMTGAGWTTVGRFAGAKSPDEAKVFSDPTSIFVDGAGRIYVVDYLNARIVRMDDMTGVGWVTIGSGLNPAISGAVEPFLQAPHGIFVDKAGRIYATTICATLKCDGSFGQGRILRIDNMTAVGWIASDAEFDGPAAIFVDDGGHIYVADRGQIVRIDDIKGRGRTSLGTPEGNGMRDFYGPRAIFVDRAGRIYVADSGSPIDPMTPRPRIVRVDDMKGTGWLDHVERHGQLVASPSAIFVDGEGRIYMTVGFHYSGIVRIDDMTGTGWTNLVCDRPLDPHDRTLPPAGGWCVEPLRLAGGIHVDLAGRIYVADSNNNRIVRVNDMTGAGWTALGSPGTGVNQFANPFSVFVDSAGRIYVADSNNNRIVRVNDMTGAGWTTFGTPGRGVNQFSDPEWIVVDEAGRIYVIDVTAQTFNSRIVRINDLTGGGWITKEIQGIASGLFVR